MSTALVGDIEQTSMLPAPLSPSNTSTFTTTDIITLIGISILLPLGTIGNIVSLILFCKSKAINSFSIYLRALCIIDCVHVLLGELSDFLSVLSNKNYSLIYHLGCDVGVYMLIYFGMYSSCILVLITLERVVAISFPFRAKVIFSVRNGVISVVALGVLLFCILTVQLGRTHYSPAIHTCMPTSLDYSWVTGALSMIWLLGYTVIPTTLLILLNSILIYKLKTKQRVAAIGAGTSSQAVQEQRLSVMALGLTCTFLVCTLPFTAMSFTYFYVGYNEIIMILVPVFRQLNMFSHASNCIMYACCSSKFRENLRNLTRCKGAPRVGSSSGSGGDKLTVALPTGAATGTTRVSGGGSSSGSGGDKLTVPLHTCVTGTTTMTGVGTSSSGNGDLVTVLPHTYATIGTTTMTGVGTSSSGNGDLLTVLPHTYATIGTTTMTGVGTSSSGNGDLVTVLPHTDAAIGTTTVGGGKSSSGGNGTC